MDDSKKTRGAWGLVFLFFVLFPFGQILKIDLNILSVLLAINPIDLVALTSVFLLRKEVLLRSPRVYKSLLSFIVIAIFSLIFSLVYFRLSEILIGLLYLLRLIGYFSLSLVFFNLVKKNKCSKPLLLDALILVGLFVGIFGWIQYFFLPDLRPFLIWGWDDHLFRLTGTFLDPGFTGIILVFGFLAASTKFLQTHKVSLALLLFFLLISLAFTYSRSSYLSFFVGTFTIALISKAKSFALISTAIFISLILILPRPEGEGVKLERTSSIYPRIESYQEGLKIFKKFPVFGIGFNNLCAFRGESPRDSHACGGIDASLLTVLATTGTVGFLIFVNFVFNLVKSLTPGSSNSLLALSSLAALGVHSLFSNSLFYPWVMGWMGVLLAISLIDKRIKG